MSTNLFLVSFLIATFQFIYYGNNRSNQYTTQKITYAMNEIKWKSCFNPGKHPIKIQTKYNRLRRCVEDAIQKTMTRIH